MGKYEKLILAASQVNQELAKYIELMRLTKVPLAETLIASNKELTKSLTNLNREV
jgi:hypothetical protein